jgi:hypothetical protein
MPVTGSGVLSGQGPGREARERWAYGAVRGNRNGFPGVPGDSIKILKDFLVERLI